MKWFAVFGLLGLVLAATLVGCQQGPTGKDKATGPETNKEYDFKGKVVNIAPDKQSVTVDHEDIPGVMAAMKMKFRVEDPKLLDGLAPGDPVQGRLKKSDGYLITQLQKR